MGTEMPGAGGSPRGTNPAGKGLLQWPVLDKKEFFPHMEPSVECCCWPSLGSLWQTPTCGCGPSTAPADGFLFLHGCFSFCRDYRNSHPLSLIIPAALQQLLLNWRCSLGWEILLKCNCPLMAFPLCHGLGSGLWGRSHGRGWPGRFQSSAITPWINPHSSGWQRDKGDPRPTQSPSNGVCCCPRHQKGDT